MNETVCMTRYPNVAMASRVTAADIHEGFVPVPVELRESLYGRDTLTQAVCQAALQWDVSPVAVRRTFKALAAGKSGRGNRVKVILTGNAVKAKSTLAAAENVVSRLHPLFTDTVSRGIAHSVSPNDRTGFYLPRLKGHGFMFPSDPENGFTYTDGCHGGARRYFTVALPPTFVTRSSALPMGSVEDLRIDFVYGTVSVNETSRSGRRINTLIDDKCAVLDVRRAAVYNTLRDVPLNALVSALDVYATSEDDVNVVLLGGTPVVRRYLITAVALWNHLNSSSGC